MQQGVPSFLNNKPDYELAPIGIASFQKQAEKLADMGRHGDTYIVHAAEGETVLPMEVLESNPKLKEMLFTQMRGMGIDPERYIVGNEFNSLNPITGQPEFFFKKIFKGLKNVGKALKKNASIVLPLALNYIVPGMGSALAGGVGAGIGSLIEGDDPREAFRSAALGGLSGAALARLTGGQGAIGRDFSKSGTFLKGLTGAEDFAEGTFRDPFKEAQQFFASGTTDPKNNVLSGAGTAGTEFADNFFEGGGMSVPGSPTYSEIAGTGRPSLKDIKYSSIPFTEGYTMKGPSVDDIINSKEFFELRLEGFTTDKAMALLQKEYAGPSFLQKYGVPLAGITGAAALGGFFDTPEEEEQEPMVTGQELIDENPEKYAIDMARLPFEDQSRVGSDYPLGGIPSLQALSPYPYPVFTANQGGPAFPRRRAGIGPGLGSGRRDDVPAMLTDGEFVMTRNAVKNAGNGNLNQGMNNMYSLMRNLEARRA